MVPLKRIPADVTGASYYQTAVILRPRFKNRLNSFRNSETTNRLPSHTEWLYRRLCGISESCWFSDVFLHFPSETEAVKPRCLFVSLNWEAALADDDCFGLHGFFITFSLLRLSDRFLLPPRPHGTYKCHCYDRQLYVNYVTVRPCSHWRKREVIAKNSVANIVCLAIWKLHPHKKVLNQIFLSFSHSLSFSVDELYPDYSTLIWYWYKARSHLARDPSCLYL